MWPDSASRRSTPRYPTIMRQAGVEGSVHMQYAVDATGRVIRPSLHVVASSHELFSQAARTAIAEHQFAAPRRAGAAVPVRVEEITHFIVPGADTLRVRLVTPTVDSIGRLTTIVTASVPFDSVNAPRLTPDDETAIYIGVIDMLLRQHEAVPSPSAFCLHIAGTSPSLQFVERWQRPGRRVVPSASCPPTYASMIVRRNDGRPKRWIDPIAIGVGRLRGWATDTVVLDATVGQGTGTSYFRCEVSRDGAGWRNVACARTRYSVS
ncbi:MAG TPA: TonB family protein [Gemmatimonadaceae bacterium]|nr:TonB family protein [Gemmatimonadaceae bacterium]